MKRILRPLLLLTALAALMSVSAFAAAGSGFYDVGTAEGVTLTPMTADSEPAEKLNVCWGTVDTGTSSRLYSGSVKVVVEIANAKKGMNYLVMLTEKDALPTQDNALLYINQMTQADGTLVFDGTNAVYPSQLATAPEGKKTVYLHIISDDPDFEAKRIEMSYANEAEYVEPEFMLGDVDMSGEIDAFDAVPVLRYSVGLDDLTATQLSAADTDGSGEVDAFDAVPILRYAAGLIDSI